MTALQEKGLKSWILSIESYTLNSTALGPTLMTPQNYSHILKNMRPSALVPGLAGVVGGNVAIIKDDDLVGAGLLGIDSTAIATSRPYRLGFRV